MLYGSIGLLSLYTYLIQSLRKMTEWPSQLHKVDKNLEPREVNEINSCVTSASDVARSLWSQSLSF